MCPYKDARVELFGHGWVGRSNGTSFGDAACTRDGEQKVDFLSNCQSRPALSRSPTCFLRAMIPRAFRVGLFEMKEWLERHGLSTKSRPNCLNELLVL